VDGGIVPSGATSYDLIDVVFNQAYGMVAATDAPGKREPGVPWAATTNVWTGMLPAGREAFAAVLLEAEVTRTLTVPLAIVEVPLSAASTGGRN
ncbi:MAG: hypothetical protein ABIT38_15970, partial [Gemmatimonadaceae bacterium]